MSDPDIAHFFKCRIQIRSFGQLPIPRLVFCPSIHCKSVVASSEATHYGPTLSRSTELRYYTFLPTAGRQAGIATE